MTITEITMIKYNGCENEGHHIDPFLCCGQTKQQTLKDLKGNDFIVIAKKGISNEYKAR